MDRISSLNAQQIAKELQGYKRYQNKTQKEIKEKVGNVSDLRDELRRLEKKSIKKESVKEVVKKDVKESVKSVKENNEFTGVVDIDMTILKDLGDRELYNICQTNKHLYQLCQNDKILKKRISKIVKFVQFPMINNKYYFANKPDISIKKNGIKFNPDKHDLLNQLNVAYRNINGITIYPCQYEDRKLNKDKIVIDEPLELTLNGLVKQIITEIPPSFFKLYPKGVILDGIKYYKDDYGNGYYLLLQKYI
jgi:hypothetical protein